MLPFLCFYHHCPSTSCVYRAQGYYRASKIKKSEANTHYLHCSEDCRCLFCQFYSSPGCERISINSVTAAVIEEESVTYNTLSSNDQISRTQKWRLLKPSKGEFDQDAPTPKRSLRVHHCGECGKVKSKLDFIIAVLMNIST